LKYNKKLSDELQSKSYKRGYVPQHEQRILTINDKTIGTLQNIVVFTGLPKAGKSTFLTAALSSSFISHPLLGMQINTPSKRNTVAYFDTESSEYDFYRSMDRVKKLLCISELPSELHSYMFRNSNHEQIKTYIEYYLSQVPQCSVIFIDGLLDLLMNYNDETESRLLINWLKQITSNYNILCCGVVHTGKKDMNTLGHFGSMIDRYSQSVLLIEKDNNKQTFSLSAKYLRSDYGLEPVILQNINGLLTRIN